jgi:hypothetical protein
MRADTTPSFSARWVLAIVAALVLPLAALEPAAAQQASDRSRLAEACPSGRVPPAGFTDVAGNPHERAIACAAWWQIVRGGAGGRPDSEYAPAVLVRRDQMAGLLARMVEASDGQPLADWNGQNRFADVDPDSVHVAAINRLAQAQVVLGRTETTFEPAGEVRRDQAASFIARAMGYVTGVDRTSDQDYFADVDPDSVHGRNINGLHEDGVIRGRAPGEYAPADPVRRDAVAAFVMRGLDAHVAEGFAAPPDAREEPLAPDPATPEPDPDATDDGEHPGPPPEATFEEQSVTDAPELQGIRPVGITSTHVSVWFMFDGEIAEEVQVERFVLYGPHTDEERFVAENAVRHPDDVDTVVAVFRRADFDLATLAAVEHGAVTDQDGRANPERSLGLSTAGTQQGVVHAPQLVEASAESTGLEGSYEVSWVFDAAVANSSGTFVVYRTDGGRLTEILSPGGIISACGTDGDTVTCHVQVTSGEIALAAVVYDAVQSDPERDDVYPNPEQARPL